MLSWLETSTLCQDSLPVAGQWQRWGGWASFLHAPWLGTPPQCLLNYCSCGSIPLGPTGWSSHSTPLSGSPGGISQKAFPFLQFYMIFTPVRSSPMQYICAIREYVVNIFFSTLRTFVQVHLHVQGHCLVSILFFNIFLISQSVSFSLVCSLLGDKRGKLEACLYNRIMLSLAHCSLLTLIPVPNSAVWLCPSLTRSEILSSHFVCTMSSSEHWLT